MTSTPVYMYDMDIFHEKKKELSKRIGYTLKSTDGKWLALLEGFWTYLFSMAKINNVFGNSACYLS